MLQDVDLDALTLSDLRRRQSVKWRLHPEDVLPLWVAELDVPLAEPVTAALRRAVDDGDTGYAWPVDLAPAFAGFAARRWGWQVDPARCLPVADVMTGVMEALRVLTDPGDGVIICPPVYHPFFTAPVECGRTVVEVPLADGALDLPGIDAALAEGARAVLLCSPHNPTGRVWTPAELDALDEVVSAHDAVVLSDEIHAPLTLPGATFTPYLSREREAVALVSASKAFNLAGLKAALLVGGSARVQERLATIPLEVQVRVGHLGALAGTAAFRDGDGWLDDLLAHLDRQRALLAEVLPAAVGYQPPQASYLAWLDFGYDAPAAHLLERARLALTEGTDFGREGAGWARLNFGTTRAVLLEAGRRVSETQKGRPGAGRP